MRLFCATCESNLEQDVESVEELASATCPVCGSAMTTRDETASFVANGRDVDATCSMDLNRRAAESSAGFDVNPIKRILGNFELVKRVGRGHFGEVWKAYDQSLHRTVALKIPRTAQLDARTIELFAREARAAARLKHENIVTLFEVRQANDEIYIVSEFIEGFTLSTVMRSRKHTPREAAELCEKIARALQHAHERSVIHRDLKPSNIMIDLEGKPYVMDFGLAKRDAAEASISEDGDILGTPAYMPPEQARGDSKNIDCRSDIYSLGVVLYELLTGERPFTGDVHLLLCQILSTEPPSPRSHKPDLPADIETICIKAMSKDPSLRYQTAAELANDLHRFLSDQPISARRPSRREQSVRWLRRHRAVATLTFVTCVAILAAGVSAAGWIRKTQSPESVPIPMSPVRAESTAPTWSVNISTEPAGAQITLMPLNTVDGLPMASEAVSLSERTPLSTRLESGDYLVVARMADGRFHEVFRHVPASEDEAPGTFPHLAWSSSPTGELTWPAISIPDNDVSSDMARFDDEPRFRMGSEGLTIAPPHFRRVPAFYLNTTEVTVGQWRAILASLPVRLRGTSPPDDMPVTLVTYDEAVAFAEAAGLRLPSEDEYEFAASDRGRSRFPWGNDADRVEAWELGPVGAVAYDRVATNPPVFGLFSNVGEWTTSRGIPYPAHIKMGLSRFPVLPHMRVVRGAPRSVLFSDPVNKEEWQMGPAYRISLDVHSAHTMLGFRCARSARPRLTSADIGAVIEE